MVTVTYCNKLEDTCYEILLKNQTSKQSNISFIVSSFEGEYEGKYSIDSLHTDKAWCPENKVFNNMKEYIIIDLGKVHVLKMIMTKGLSRHGYKSASYYFIKYRRETNEDWKRYGNASHYQKIAGNDDHLTEKFKLLQPSIIARWIKIYPVVVNKPEMICLNLQLFGCIYKNHVMEYRVMDGSRYYAVSPKYQNQLRDQTYDGVLLNNGYLQDGLGKLSDQDFQRNDSYIFYNRNQPQSPYIGWNRRNFIPHNFVNIDFRFDCVRKFEKVRFRLSNARHMAISLPSTIEVKLRVINVITNNQEKRDQVFRKDVVQDYRNRNSKWVELDLAQRIGKYASVDLYFSSVWILMREVEFISKPYRVKEENIRLNENIPIYKGNIHSKIPPFKYPSNFYNQSPNNNNSNSLSKQYPSLSSQKPIHPNNILTISDIFLSSSISLAILFLLGICLFGYIRWRRRNRIRKYKKALHLQSQDEEYHRILTLQHSSHLKSPKFYQQVMSSPTYSDKIKPKEDITYQARNIHIPDVYWMYSELNQENNSNHDIYSVDSSKYMTVDGKPSPEKCDSNIQGPFGNSRMIKTPSLSTSCEDSKQNIEVPPPTTFIDMNHLSILDTLIPTKYGMIYIMEDLTVSRDQTMNQTISPRNITFRQLNADTPLHIRKLVQSELEILSNLNHPNIIKYWTAHSSSISSNNQHQTSSSSSSLFILSDYTNLTDIYSLFVALPFSSTPTAVSNNNNNNNNNNTNSLNPSSLSSPSVLLQSSLSSVIDNNALLTSNTDNGFSSLSIESSHLLYIATQVSMAMGYLETHNIVHRDLACRNIIITDTMLSVKLCDIAIATARFRSHYCSSQLLSPITKEMGNCNHVDDCENTPVRVSNQPASQILLPIRWLSWEALVQNNFSSKSDIYAFGITIWELLQLCRQLPYAAMTDYQIFYNKYALSSNNQPQQRLQYPPNTAREICDIVEQCLLDDPAQRPSFNEVQLFFANKTIGYKPRDILGPYLAFL